MNLDDFAPPGLMRFGLITCSNCEKKYITTEGTDNAYLCECKNDLMREEQTQYDAPEEDVIKFLEKNYKGKNIGSRN